MGIIPELEDKITKKLEWSDDEIDTLNRYYPKIAEKDLVPHLKNRNVGSIRVKAHELGLTKKRDKK
jgi:hypothetical protein